MPFQPHVALGLVRRKIVEDDMDFAFRIGGDDLVHEIEEFDAPASFVMAADDFPTRKIEGGEQCRRPMPLIIVRLARHGAPVGQLQIALRTFERWIDGFSSTARTMAFSGGAM